MLAAAKPLDRGQTSLMGVLHMEQQPEVGHGARGQCWPRSQHLEQKGYCEPEASK